MSKIIIATGNEGKYLELFNLLKLPGFEFIRPEIDLSIEEIGGNFADNALLKAKYAYKTTGITSIADDSGLEIEALDGFPGIFSARCAGENVTGKEKVNFVLEKMKGIKNRNASFVCALAIVTYNFCICHVGRCYGQLLDISRGIAKSGLQYDSIFYIPELEKTFTEMSDEEKNKISHRGMAAKQIKRFLGSL